jgi:hypothetical protein
VGVYHAVSELKPARIWDGVIARVVHGEKATIGFIEIDPNILVPSTDTSTSRSASCCEVR